MIGFSMTLQTSQALDLRQSLEIKLEQNLVVIQKIMLQLALYKNRENYLTKLYAKALKRGQVKLYNKHGLKFEYALVNNKEVPNDILRDCGPAFSHVLFSAFEALFQSQAYARSRGSWLLFVVKDFYPATPPEFLEYWAVHERGEQVTLGNHNLATKLEFLVATREQNIRHYIQWLEQNSPDHLANVFAYQMHLALPDDEDFQALLQLSLQTEEVQLIRQSIEEFTWPYSLLQKLALYDKNNEKILLTLHNATDSIVYFIENPHGNLEHTYLQIQKIMAAHFHEIALLRKFLSVSRLTAEWKSCINKIADKMTETISRLSAISEIAKQNNPNAPTDFLEILTKHKLDADPLPKQGVFQPNIAEAFDYALNF